MMSIMMLLRWMIIGSDIADMGTYGRKIEEDRFLFFFLYTLYKYGGFRCLLVKGFSLYHRRLLSTDP